MKNTKALIAVLILVGGFAAADTARATEEGAAPNDGVVVKDELILGNYCHTKFPAIDPETLGTDRPALTSGGDLVDYYGPCDESPTGQDQVRDQEQDDFLSHQRD